MRSRAVLLHILRGLGIAVAAILLLVFCYVRTQEHLLRHRAAHLLADFQSIHLNQTSWRNAQAMMKYWGGWGYTRGPCSRQDCYYTVVLSDAPTRIMVDSNWGDSLRPIYRIYEIAGGTESILLLHFTVENGVIAQSSFSYLTAFPNSRFTLSGESLGIEARSSSSLGDRSRAYGSYAQLALHPEYRVGKPGACEICEDVKITYTPYLEFSELKRLTNFNLSCITRYHACTQLTDFLPVASAWHFYDRTHIEPVEKNPFPPPYPCRISPWILGRDSQIAVEVETLSTTAANSPDGPDNDETSTVRLIRVIKNLSNKTLPKIFDAHPFSGFIDSTDKTSSEHLVPHHRYILLFEAEYMGMTKDQIGLNRCGVLQDTPQTISELEKGIELDKPIRNAEHDNDAF
jgi:hypothetical protein